MQTSTSIILAAQPVVDIDGTVFVQLTLFLLLLAVLERLLFRPWLEVRDRRHAAISGAFAAAEELQTKASKLDAEYAERLGQARESALNVRSELRRDAESNGSDKIAQARSQASRSLDAARGQISTQVARARTDLVARIEVLAREISERVLGRAA
ncbi:MAG: hypothetical protein B7733_20235 [Myxococcales bacterium FL481]|nr:MAG: hypothetical protein B7733_20235 [Myxococcales bacterium FL481]